MAYTYTTIDGKRVEVNVAAAFRKMAADFKKATGYTLHVSDGTRTWDEQLAFWNLYQSGKGNLALHPSSPLAYHVETNPSGPRALDIRDSGTTAGVTVAGNARSNWIRNNASKYGFDPAGYGFSQVEPWHIEFRGKIGGQAASIPVAEPSAAQVLESGGLVNSTIIVKAASAAGLDLAIAAAVIQKESNGRNVFGHDAGGAYHGGGEVTEAKYKDFIKQVRGGKTSNGVGPAQITWPSFFTEMENQGLKPWVPYDNMLYGFRLMVDYLGGKTTDAAIRSAGKRYNGNASYGDDLLVKVREWRQRLAGRNVSTAPTKGDETIASRQRFLKHDRGESALVADGFDGPQTQAAVRRYQAFLGVQQDGIWGAGTESAHQQFKATGKSPKASVSNPFGIANVEGLQKIAALYGYTGRIDNIWGSGSAAGFAKFLRGNHGYSGNDVLGPVMWASIARWLRGRWGYVGNDVPGPVMRAALTKANAANKREL